MALRRESQYVPLSRSCREDWDRVFMPEDRKYRENTASDCLKGIDLHQMALICTGDPSQRSLFRPHPQVWTLQPLQVVGLPAPLMEDAANVLVLKL